MKLLFFIQIVAMLLGLSSCTTSNYDVTYQDYLIIGRNRINRIFDSLNKAKGIIFKQQSDINDCFKDQKQLQSNATLIEAFNSKTGKLSFFHTDIDDEKIALCLRIALNRVNLNGIFIDSHPPNFYMAIGIASDPHDNIKIDDNLYTVPNGEICLFTVHQTYRLSGNWGGIKYRKGQFFVDLKRLKSIGKENYLLCTNDLKLKESLEDIYLRKNTSVPNDSHLLDEILFK